MAEASSNSDGLGVAAWRVIEPYWKAVSIYDGPIVFLDGFEQMPEPARHVFAVWWCDAEVCNGGFHQFFFNSTGVLAPEALEGFRAVGLLRCAELLEIAMGKFDEPYPRDRDAREAALEALARDGEKRSEWDPFYEFDDRYYNEIKGGRLFECLDDFARRHTG